MISQFYGQSSYYLLEQDLSVRKAKLILEEKKKKNQRVIVTYIVILFLT